MQWNLPARDCEDFAAASTRRSFMQDAAMLLFTVIFFALAFLYVKACQKLR